MILFLIDQLVNKVLITLLVDSITFKVICCRISMLKEKMIHQIGNPYEKSHLSKSHYPTTKTQKKKLIYNCCVTILWVLQLLCNYPFRVILY